MKYRKFTIEPVYTLCSDFRINRNGLVHDRKPTSKDVDCYQIYCDEGKRWIVGDTIPECKQIIDDFLAKLELQGLTL